MKPNPYLKKLGFSDDDRVVILHADDIGMCQASITAFIDLWESRSISSAATMVPCPWFPAAAAYCRTHHQVDLGVHTTLNSEWTNYRWAPLSTRDKNSGLLDEEGYLHHSSEGVQNNAEPSYVKIELITQVTRAFDFGIDVSHIDTHMGTVTHPNFVGDYIQIAIDHKLPVMVPRQDESGFRKMGLDGERALFAVQLVEKLDAMGVPLPDHVQGLPLDRPENRFEQAKRAIENLPPGITHFIIHPSANTPELRAITLDWPGRVADYETFRSEAMRSYLQGSGVRVIGYRALRDLYRDDQSNLLVD